MYSPQLDKNAGEPSSATATSVASNPTRPASADFARAAFLPTAQRIALIGAPNVGKSVLFHLLTGRYVVVSNYPGTTVEVAEGDCTIGGERLKIIDTPGMYSLSPITDEERVTRSFLLEQELRAVVHIVDEKNLARMLPLTLELRQLGLPLLLVLNMHDEAECAGISVDATGLGAALELPVVQTTLVQRRGMNEVMHALTKLVASRPAAPLRLAVNRGDKSVLTQSLAPQLRPAPSVDFAYDPAVEQTIAQIGELLPARFAPYRRGISALLAIGDEEVLEWVRDADQAAAVAISELVSSFVRRSPQAPRLLMSISRQHQAQKLVDNYAAFHRRPRRAWSERLSQLTINPLTGLPLVLLVLYLGLYKFVGVFGAGTVVSLLEKNLFGEVLNPRLDSWLLRILPGAQGFPYWLRELFGGEYGIFTLGVTYAVAIVLPLVSFFFLFFSVLEDSGYFPRLAMLVDRLFKKIGLNGRAVIPLVLGFGCDTMATLVTRIQETKRERIITTLLLALAIPCSAQLGVMTGLLAQRPVGLLGVPWPFVLWGLITMTVFFAAGALISRLLPGEGPAFYMELPPLRVPRLGNVVMKTLARIKWYFWEIMPLFIFASLLIWVGRLTGLFDYLVAGCGWLAQHLLGLPASSGAVFLYGFFRRDFGVAGLYGLVSRGQLSDNQLLVACTTLTLFLPCVAQLLIMKKERGLRTTALMAVSVVVTACLVGAALNLLLNIIHLEL